MSGVAWFFNWKMTARLRWHSSCSLLLFAGASFMLKDVQCQSACAQGSVGDEEPTDHFAVIRDVQNPSVFRSIQNYCPDKGWSDQDSKSYSECYEQTLLELPPFHMDLSRLSDCSEEDGGIYCDECDQCVKPLKLHVTSLAIEEFVFSSQKDEVHVTVASELFWADPRLWGTAVSDVTKVWRPHWHIAVHAVNETREKLEREQSDRLEETHTSQSKLVAPVYDPALDSFDTRTSYISCLSMDMPASCNTQDLQSCGVRERLTQTVVAKMAHTLYDRYPFDNHILRLELSFPNPYTFIANKAAWGVTTALQVDWGHGQEERGGMEEFDNADGSDVLAPRSLIKSLDLLTIPGFAHASSIKLSPDQPLFVTFELTRRSSGILQRFGLPMIFLTFVTTLVPTLGMEQFHPRNIVCIIGMLTAVTLNNGAKSSSPAEASQSTWFDNVFLVSICFAYGALMENFVVLWLNQLKWKITRDVLDKFFMYTLPLYYLSALLLLSLVQLSSKTAHHVGGAVPLALTFLFSVYVLVRLIIQVRKKRLQVADTAKDPEAAQPLTSDKDQITTASTSTVAFDSNHPMLPAGAGVAGF